MSEKEKESGKGIVGEGYDDLDGQTGNGNCTASSRDKGNVKRDASTVFASASTSASSSTPTPSSSKLSSKPKNTKSQPKSNTPSPSTSASHTLTALALTFLGTASAQPSSTRAHSSLALTLEGRKGGEVWLFDCGEGTQGRIMQSGGGEGKVKVKMGKVGKVFLTHLHGEVCL
jgi:cytoskeletal protein RodZ